MKPDQSRWATVLSFLLHIAQIGIILLIFNYMPSQTIHEVEGNVQKDIKAIYSMVTEIKSDIKTVHRLEADYKKVEKTIEKVENEIDKIKKVKDDIHTDLHKIKKKIASGKYKHILKDETSKNLKGAIDKAIEEAKHHRKH